FKVVQTLRPDNGTPSLHIYYRCFITTTSSSVPALCIGIFSYGFFHLLISLFIKATGSHVPY
ncbi:hypothetical protein, partial [Leptospira santarosai]|uniref:hypothetical protein n=1 Tax=Leptospira santarosai TaxID=28183 RepID=UPI001F17E4DC